MSNATKLASMLPKLTLFYTLPGDRLALSPFCYKLAYELSDASNDSLACSFRTPIADMLATIKHWSTDLDDPEFVDYLNPEQLGTSIRNLIDAIESAIADNFGPDYLGELAAHWLSAAYLDKSRIIYYDATDPNWIQTTIRAVGKDYLILHLYQKITVGVRNHLAEGVEDLDVVSVYIDDPTDLNAAITAISRELGVAND